VHSSTKQIANLSLNLVIDDDQFEVAIARVGGKFDAIVIDCQSQDGSSDAFRVARLRASLAFATDNCLFIIDNTDAM
jgi:hypothetical protein